VLQHHLSRKNAQSITYERYKDCIGEFELPSSFPQELPLFYFVSGFAHPKLPVVKHDGIELYYWGLIPTWVKDEKQAKDFRKQTLNAIGETVFEKPSFRSIKTKRCLLGVNGFFEWRDLKGVKFPYYISHRDEKIFSLGCLYENWLNKATGELVNTFAIITTPANPMMEKIHNLKKRMPLIIDRTNEKKWIDPDLENEEIKELIQPYDQDKNERTYGEQHGEQCKEQPECAGGDTESPIRRVGTKFETLIRK
jgi:putative SOS response-associated peptidase YedK